LTSDLIEKALWITASDSKDNPSSLKLLKVACRDHGLKKYQEELTKICKRATPDNGLSLQQIKRLPK